MVLEIVKVWEFWKKRPLVRTYQNVKVKNSPKVIICTYTTHNIGTYGEWTDWSQCSSSCYDEGDPNSNIPKVEPKRGRTRKCLGGQYFTCDNLGDRIEVVDCEDCKHCRFNGGSAEYDSGDYKCHF